MDMIEQCGLLNQHWYAAALTKELKVNKPFSCMIFELPLVLWKRSDGSVVAFLDRCTHRNAPLSYGKIQNDCLVCPYHGWTYNPAGECVQIPSEGNHKERIMNRQVESFPVRQQDDLLWVWMGRQTEPDHDPFSMPIIRKPGWRYYYMQTDFNNNVTNLVENFMDVPHTVFVHKGWFRDKKQLRVPMTVERTDNSVLVSYHQKSDSIGAFNWLVNPKKLPMIHTDKFYMPNNTRVDYIFGEEERGFVISSTCTPVKPDFTRVYTLIAYKFGMMNPLASLFLPPYTRKVIEQDVWIMDIQGQNLKKFPTPEFKSTPADTLHVYIESLRNWAASGGEGPKPNPIKKDGEFWI